MIIRTYTAPDLEKALWLLTEDLGSAAVILKTRFNSGDADRPLKYIEITAALDSSLYRREDIEYLKEKPAHLSQLFLQQIAFDADFSDQSDPTPVPEVFEVIGW
jgi:hypothetical protein